MSPASSASSGTAIAECTSQEVRVKPQAERAALLRMKLGRDHVVAPEDAGEGHTVIGLAHHPGLVLWVGVIAVDEVEVGARIYTLKGGVRTQLPHLVPAHMRDLQAARKPPHAAGD